MDIQELSKIHFRYVRIRLDNEYTRYENIDFTNLLVFIGKNNPIGDRNAIGCAYRVIQKETDRLLHVSWLKNHNLKTSKREISSIRMSKYWIPEGRGKHYFIRIPYKISYIFTAIINIIKKISETEAIPHELEKCIGLAYGVSFYAYHIEKYDLMYRQRFKEDARLHIERSNPAKLFNEFHSHNSVFEVLFP